MLSRDDAPSVASQLLRALRGRRSQVAFSRRLGYRSNVAADWEQGRRFPTGGELMRVLRVVGQDPPTLLQAFHPPTAALAGDCTDDELPAWLDAQRGRATVQELAARMGASRHAVGRWLAGRSRPRLPDLLALIDAMTGRVHDLVAGMVDIQAVPLLAVRVERARAAREVGLDEPWALPVLLAIETEGYAALPAHDPAWLAGFLDLPEERVERCLARLLDAGVVRREGERLVPGAPLTIDTRAHPELGRALKRHWLHIGMDRISRPRPGDVLGSNLFVLSRAELQRVRELQRAFYREVRGIGLGGRRATLSPWSRRVRAQRRSS